MKLLIKRPLKPLAVLLALLFATVFAFAQATDTVSTADVQFTTIPTHADSINALKKHRDSITKAEASLKSAAKPVAQQPQTLWQIFIAGFLGGFAAFLMPCIYPMLPLTVSFFTKKAACVRLET